MMKKLFVLSISIMLICQVGTAQQDGWIKYCVSDEVTGRIGFPSVYSNEMTAAMRFTPEDLAAYDVATGDSIIKVAIGVGTDIVYWDTMEIKIWEGGNSITNAGELVYTQPVTNYISFPENTMTEIVLTTPFIIDATKELRIGWRVNCGTCFPIGHDAGTAVAGKGDLFMVEDYFINGWFSLSQFDINYNISIKAFIDKNPCRPVKNLSTEIIDNNSILLSWTLPEGDVEIEGYYIFRNDIPLTTALITTTSYLDENLTDGIYEYYVKTYCKEDCISDSSNHVIEIIETCEAINDLTAEKNNDNSILLTWTKPKEDLEIEGYHVYCNEQLQTDVLITTTSYLDENLPVGKYEYYVITHYTNGCVSDSSNHVKETVALGIEKIDDGITIFPNPTSSKIEITNFESRIDNVDVFDVFGRKVSSQYFNISSSHHKIDISELNAGIYFVRLTTKQGIVTKKIIKY